MSLSITRESNTLTENQAKRVLEINKPVGAIKLKMLEGLVKATLKSQGLGTSIVEDGFRSMYKPEMLDAPMKKFLEPKKFEPSKARLSAAVSTVSRRLKGLGLCSPLSLEESHQRVIHAKENNFSGLPTMGKKVDDTEALARAKQCWKGKCPPPAVIGHRGKNTVVVRAVWMFPFEWHIIEGAYFFPLQEKFKSKVPIYAAQDAVNRRARIRSLIASGSYESKLAMDYSSFDASIGSQLIGIAFNILREHLRLDDHEQKVWDRVATYFGTCPFIDQYGMLVTGRRGGVPSGSMFTQMIDTIVNAIVLEYSIDCKEKKYLVYGDDSLILLSDTVDVTLNSLDLIRSRAYELGILVNLKKTHVCSPTTATLFLGHYDLRNGRPVEDVLTRLIYPERPSKDHSTAAGLRNRVIAYMAESDESISILLPVYQMLCHVREGITLDIDSFAGNYGEGITRIEVNAFNPRSASGLLQFLMNEDPKLATGYMKIRAAV